MGDIKMLDKARLKGGRVLAVYKKCRERVPNRNDTYNNGLECGVKVFKGIIDRLFGIL